MAEILLKIKGKFIMSINDHRWIRKTFSRFFIKEVNLKYSCTNNSAARSAIQTELLIMNYKA